MQPTASRHWMPGHRTLLAISPLFLLLAAAAVGVPQAKSFAWLNAYHHPLLDQVLGTLTLLGDGLLMVVLAGWMALRRHWALALCFLLCLAACGLCCQSLKLWLSSPRPAAILSASAHPLFNGEGVLKGFNSFPSGHTCTAFASATMLFFRFGRPCYVCSMACLLLATLVGFSRIYLGHHFLPDVMAGAALGTALGAWAYLAWLPWMLRQKPMLRPAFFVRKLSSTRS